MYIYVIIDPETEWKIGLNLTLEKWSELMGDTSTKLQEKSGSNLGSEPAVSPGNTQHSDPEYSKNPKTDIANTDGQNIPELNSIKIMP